MSSNTPPEWPVEQPDLSADASAESTPLESVCADTAGASLKVETLEAREPGESIESQAGADAPRSDGEPHPLHELVVDKQTELKRFAKVLNTMATILGPLAKPTTYFDAKKALSAVATAKAKLPSEMLGRSDGEQLLDYLKETSFSLRKENLNQNIL